MNGDEKRALKMRAAAGRGRAALHAEFRAIASDRDGRVRFLEAQIETLDAGDAANALRMLLEFLAATGGRP